MADIAVYPITTPTLYQDRRHTVIGMSQVAALFGLHKYLTIAALTAWLRGDTTLGPDPDSPIIKRGLALEKIAAEETGKQNPTWQITKCNNHYVDHDAGTGASPDFLVSDPKREGIGDLQTKVIAEPQFRKLEGAPDIAHLLQLSGEMMHIPGCTWGAVAY